MGVNFYVFPARTALVEEKPNDHVYQGTVTYFRENLHIRVAPENIERTLRFMNTLIKSLRVRGHDIQVKYDATYVIVGDSSFKTVFREKMKMELVNSGYSWNSAVYHPTGILCLSCIKEWKDGKVPIEGQLSKIIAQLELSA